MPEERSPQKNPKAALKANAEKVAKWPAYLRVYSSAYLRKLRS